MPSKFITPPDHIPSDQNILIINALDNELATLVLWLKTIRDSYDIHLYHSLMPDSNWIVDAIQQAAHILVSKPEMPAVSSVVKSLLDANQERIIYFGKGTDYPDLIHYFLVNREQVS